VGEDPWALSAGIIDISFAITETGTISLGADGELTNTLRLTVAPAPTRVRRWIDRIVRWCCWPLRRPGNAAH
jgi:hypothetical protein